MAFAYIDRDLWRGGYNYLHNLFVAIGEVEDAPLKPCLYVGSHVGETELAPFRTLDHVEVIVSPLFDEMRVKRQLLRTLVVGYDSQVRAQLASDRIDLVFENARYFFGWRFPLPVIAWLPDFQHCHLPKMYGRMSWWKREIGYRVQVASRQAVLLSSEDARRDCERFYPSSRGKTAVVNFATRVEVGLLPELTETRVRSYGLEPGNYFFFPGQLYKHKNHLLVIRALGLLRQEGVQIDVAFSGETDDLRSRGFFNELSEEASAHGVSGQARFLGNIPFIDLLALMAHARAMLNPSLFEGWSTVVEEARSLGVPMLLSDLDVHQEQMGEAATYFDRTRAESLARCMREFPWVDPQLRLQQRVQAIADADARVRCFGENFVDFTRQMLAEYS